VRAQSAAVRGRGFARQPRRAQLRDAASRCTLQVSLCAAAKAVQRRSQQPPLYMVDESVWPHRQMQAFMEKIGRKIECFLSATRANIRASMLASLSSRCNSPDAKLRSLTRSCARKILSYFAGRTPVAERDCNRPHALATAGRVTEIPDNASALSHCQGLCRKPENTLVVSPTTPAARNHNAIRTELQASGVVSKRITT